MHRAFLVFVAVVAFPMGARAELRDVAARAADEWARAGGRVVRAPARFLYDDQTMNLGVPADPRGACTYVALIGARGLSFHARVVDSPDASFDDIPLAASSLAGVLEIARCGGAPIRRIVVTSDAGRGAIEPVIAHADRPLPALQTLLPERTGGVLPAPPDTGAVPPLAHPAARADVAETQAKRDGARVLPRESWDVGADGVGQGMMTIDAGCHRIEVFAVDPQNPVNRRPGRLDVDAELRTEDGEAMLGRDHTDAPDARIDVCVGQSVAAVLTFAGAAPGGQAFITHAIWSIPEHMPDAWGPEVRARMAGALFAHRLRPPSTDAVLLAQGPSGRTLVPMEVEPGGCYVAIAMAHGHPRGFVLHATVGARDARDEHGSGELGGALAFCAGDRTRAEVGVEARGSAVGWTLAVFRVESGVWQVAP